MPSIVKVLEARYINHDVKLFKVEKPKGYVYIPGQATDISVNEPKWKKELRPFTFTSLNSWDHLEFIIKIYPGHEGVTKVLGRINEGDTLILHDVWGTIQYKGNGVFIAAGTGVTPFISILRDLQSKKKLLGDKLICSNHTSQDVILPEELHKMLKNNFINFFTRENNIGFSHRRIDRDFLIDHVRDFSQYFYICGPDEFVKHISQLLRDLGAESDSLVFEQ